MRWFPLFVVVPACAWLTDEEVAKVVDADGDGADSVAFGGEDCDDGDPDVGPGRQLSTRPVTVYVDADGDGLGWAATTTEACWPPDGYAAQAGDCDDATADVGAGWPQFHDDDGDGLGGDAGPLSSTCDGPDDGFVYGDTDCDDADRDVGEVYPEQWQDGDGDGFGNVAAPRVEPTCRVAEGFVTNKDDCDDTESDVGGPTTWYVDADQDTYGVDGPATVAACGQPIVDGKPMSANEADCDDENALVGVTALQFPDLDHDGFGDRDAMPAPSGSCVPDTGFVTNAADCDDQDSLRSPNSVWYRDLDDDGLGAGSAVQQCLRAEEEGFGLVAGATDCDDSDPNAGDHGWEDADADTYGGTALGGCGGVYVSGDCDDTHEEVHPGVRWYADADGDGYADEFESTVSCELVVGSIREDLRPPEPDCDDDDPAVNPETVWFVDGDQDGVGAGMGVVQCEGIDASLMPMALFAGDCDDGDPAVRDEPTYVDLDHDGWGGAEDGCDGDVRVGGDCDDDDELVNPDTRWVEDVDGDGFGPKFGEVAVSCEQPVGYVPEPLDDGDVDCDDADATLNPTTQWWPDADEDGAGDAGGAVTLSCDAPGVAYSRDATDCADDDVTVIEALRDVDGDLFGGPQGDPDRCPGGLVEPGWVTLPGDCDDDDDQRFPGQTWFRDLDGDGFGGALIATACEVSDGLAVVMPGDCDDDDLAVKPGVPDAPLDGLDANCDGTDLDGDGDHQPDVPCANPFVHEVHSQMDLDDFAPSLLSCDLVILHPPTDGASYQGFVALADAYWAPEPGVVVEGAGTGVVVEGGAVVLEGFELRGFEGGALRLRSNVDLTASDLRIEGGSGIVDELELPSAGLATRELTLVGLTFEDTDSLLSSGGQRTGQKKSGVRVRSLSMREVRAEGLVTTGIGVDVVAEQDIAVDGLSLEHGAAFEGFVRLQAGTDLTLTGFALLDSLTSLALDLRASGALTVTDSSVEDNGFLPSSSLAAVVSLRAPEVTLTDFQLLRNQGGGAMTWIEACGDDAGCGVGKASTLLGWDGGELVGNYSSEFVTLLRTYGDVVASDVAVHQQEGVWWAVDGDVDADHLTFGGRPVEVTYSPGLPPARFTLAAGARVRLVGSVLDYRQTDSLRLLDRGPVDLEGSLVEGATATWCNGGTVCTVTGGWTFSGAAGLRGSHVYMPPRDHDARLSTTSLAVAHAVGALLPTVHPERYPDTDGDGLLDDWEERHFGDLTPTASQNGDSDLLTNLQECERGTNPTVGDIDQDGLEDSADLYPYGGP